MTLFLDTILKTVSVGGVMLILLEIGRRIGRRAMVNNPAAPHEGLGAVEGAVFGLMGLMIALTFSSAALRFDHRRMLILEEANAIGTAYLRVDLLPDDAQPLIRGYFREYLETRITLYDLISDDNKVAELQNKSDSLQKKIWKASVNASRQSVDNSASLLLLPALNSMIDIYSTRTAIRQIHQPNIIFFVLIILSLICSLMAGFGMSVRKSRSWIHLIGFSLVLVLTIVVIVDLEYPRAGFIRIDALDVLLTDLRKLML